MWMLPGTDVVKLALMEEARSWRLPGTDLVKLAAMWEKLDLACF